jgi:hypothetical protein
MSEHGSEQRCIVTLDIESLGFRSADDAGRLVIDEIAQGAAIDVEAPDKVSLKLEPFETCVIVLRRTG